MYCPNCGTQLGDDDAFCASCGAQTGAQDAPAAQQAAQPTPPPQPTEPIAQSVPPTQQMPAQPTGGWQQPPPGVQPPPGAQPPIGTPPPGMGLGASPPPPPPSSGLKIALIIGAIVAVVGVLGVGAFLMLRGGDDPPPEPPVVTQTDPVATTTPPPADPTPRYPNPEDAVAAELPTDWVFDIVDNSAGRKEYWAGPPASEYDTVYIVEPAADGGWEVTDVYALDGLDGMLPEDEAVLVVEDFLIAVMEDRAEDAQALTIPPFSNDPASASFSNGDFLDYTVESVTDMGDGTFEIVVAEEWVWGIDRWVYTAAPTEMGYFVSELRPL